MIIYDKLVRDNIPDIIASKGKTAVVHVADGSEYDQRLIDKLREEVEEFVRDRNAEELADILEVIRALCLHQGIDPHEVEAVRAKKQIERGGFERRLVLEKTE